MNKDNSNIQKQAKTYNAQFKNTTVRKQTRNIKGQFAGLDLHRWSVREGSCWAPELTGRQEPEDPQGRYLGSIASGWRSRRLNFHPGVTSVQVQNYKRELEDDERQWNKYMRNLKKTPNTSTRKFNKIMTNILIKRRREKKNKQQKWKKHCHILSNTTRTLNTVGEIHKLESEDRSEARRDRKEEEQEKEGEGAQNTSECGNRELVCREGERVSNLPRLFGSASGGETPPEETKESTDNHRKEGTRRRNTKRGLRSKKATEERKIKRKNKRREARRKKREGKRGIENNLVVKRGRKGRKARASAQGPKIWTNARGIWMATLNVDGMLRQGKREEVEAWMKKHNIAILFLQETHSAWDSREARGSYTWYFSGEKKLLEEQWTAGVGVVIDNKHIQHVEDVEPLNDRMIRLTIKGSMPTTMLGVYMPQAGRLEADRDKAYDTLNRIIRKYKGRGPIYIVGDMNARIQKAEGRLEKEHIGKYTFEPETAERPHLRSTMVNENREKLITLCQTHKLRVMSTMFKKQKEKLATYRNVGTPIWWEVKRGHPYGYEQMDYILTTERWKNTVKDVEADPKPNIETRHYPVKARIRIKLKGVKKIQQSR